jgi:hypothetical protein
MYSMREREALDTVQKYIQVTSVNLMLGEILQLMPFTNCISDFFKIKL